MKRLEDQLLFLTALFLPTQLGRHFWPDFSFVYSLPIDYLSPALYFWDLLVILLIVVSVFKKRRFSREVLNLFFLFILTQLLSLIPFNGKSVDLDVGLVRLEQYLISGLFGVYLASRDFKAVAGIIFTSISFAVSLESILAILQFIKGHTLGLWILGERSFSLTTPAISKFDFYGIQFLRPYATFPHPNVLSAFMVISLPILLLLKPKFAKLPLLLSTCLGVLTILLTVSRTAMIAGFFEALLLLRKRILILFILILVVPSPLLYTRFAGIFNFDVLSLVRREEQSIIALGLWFKQPIFGVGLNNFIPQASDLLLSGPNRFLQPVHNIFLLSLSETGILGLLGFLGLIGYPIYRLFKLKERKLILIWSAVVFLGMFDHYFLTLPQGYRLLFLVWGISFSRSAKRAMLELKSAKNT